MLLALDVGNTHTVLGLFDKENLFKSFRITTDKKKTYDECFINIRGLFFHNQIELDKVTDVIISSVVPDLTLELKKMCLEYLNLEPVIVDSSLETGIKICLSNPEEVGADRIVNVVAAVHFYDRGLPIIIADFGTATTFDVVSKDKEYLGGAILPGIGISVDALFKKASKLPKVELVRPPKVIGNNTIESMQSGIIFGYASQVDGIVEKMKKELQSDVVVIATGGIASIIEKECTTIEIVDKFLTLKGLQIINERIKKG